MRNEGNNRCYLRSDSEDDEEKANAERGSLFKGQIRRGAVVKLTTKTVDDEHS